MTRIQRPYTFRLLTGLALACLVQWSTIDAFSQDNPLTPTPSYPADGLVVPTNVPELNWWVGAPVDNMTFEVQIEIAASNDPVCNQPAWPSGITGTQQITSECDPALLPGETYQWRVRASEDGLQSDWSDWAVFTTDGNGLAVAATPSYPVGDLEIFTTTPELHWFTEQNNTGIAFTAYLLGRDAGAPADCEAIRTDGDAVSISSVLGVTHVDAEVDPGSTYDWCVRSSGPNGDFDSPVAHFSVAGGGVLSAPVASWPVGNAIVYQTSPSLHWYVEGSSADLTG